MYFQFEKMINNPKNRNFLSENLLILLVWVIFDLCEGKKSRSVDFSQYFIELVRKCLGVVFDLNRSTFGCIFSSKD